MDRLRELVSLQLGDQILRIAELTLQLEAAQKEIQQLKDEIAQLKDAQKGDGPIQPTV